MLSIVETKRSCLCWWQLSLPTRLLDPPWFHWEQDSTNEQNQDMFLLQPQRVDCCHSLFCHQICIRIAYSRFHFWILQIRICRFGALPAKKLFRPEVKTQRNKSVQQGPIQTQNLMVAEIMDCCFGEDLVESTHCYWRMIMKEFCAVITCTWRSNVRDGLIEINQTRNSTDSCVKMGWRSHLPIYFRVCDQGEDTSSRLSKQKPSENILVNKFQISLQNNTAKI